MPRKKMLTPIAPGEILREFMDEHDISANKLARELDVPTNRVLGILNAARSITADTALRLARFFGTSPEMWMNLQAGYDLRLAREERGDAIETRVRVSDKAPKAAA